LCWWCDDFYCPGGRRTWDARLDKRFCTAGDPRMDTMSFTSGALGPGVGGFSAGPPAGDGGGVGDGWGVGVWLHPPALGEAASARARTCVRIVSMASRFCITTIRLLTVRDRSSRAVPILTRYEPTVLIASRGLMFSRGLTGVLDAGSFPLVVVPVASPVVVSSSVAGIPPHLSACWPIHSYAGSNMACHSPIVCNGVRMEAACALVGCHGPFRRPG